MAPKISQLLSVSDHKIINLELKNWIVLFNHNKEGKSYILEVFGSSKINNDKILATCFIECGKEHWKCRVDNVHIK